MTTKMITIATVNVRFKRTRNRKTRQVCLPTKRLQSALQHQDDPEALLSMPTADLYMRVAFRRILQEHISGFIEALSAIRIDSWRKFLDTLNLFTKNGCPGSLFIRQLQGAA
jgi:hypothetical protein